MLYIKQNLDENIKNGSSTCFKFSNRELTELRQMAKFQVPDYKFIYNFQYNCYIRLYLVAIQKKMQALNLF